MISLRSVALSFQLTILKVLDGHPSGRATLEELKRYLAVLMTSGPEWTARMKRMETRAGGSVDIFGKKLIVREPGEWRITDAGRAFLAALEHPPAEHEPTLDELIDDAPSRGPPPLSNTPQRRVNDRKGRPGRRGRTPRERRSA
ncbi:hypothetical protein IVA77_23755 [Bradyrhizobium sp. 136]|nr:hypothetical protein [Bradyrhizobium sp. 15]MCK1614386.1 hypothetical protein [Bradyrhizobium sp. 163]MCK1764495.1 hypothetical protein [Bradyrhizobium sp. 136]